MSKPRPDESWRDETERSPLIEWSVAWLTLLAAAAMLVGALAKFLPG